VISVLALALAVGGGAFALASSDSRQDKKIAKKVVKKLAPHLSVKYAKSAGTATHAASADSATRATSADSATRATDADQLGGTPASSYLLGGGRVLFARLSFPDSTGAGKTILTLPGLGRIETYACNSGSIVFAAQYHNTSSQPEDLWLDEQNQTGDTSSYHTVAAGAILPLVHNAYETWQHSLLTVGAGTGSAAKAATASVGVSFLSPSCTYQAQAAVQPGS
jgi:hypothetical protein